MNAFAFKFTNLTNQRKFIFFRRRPAWTDRVLYKEPKNIYKNAELSAEQTSYRSHPGYSISDHKPVTSEFTIKVKFEIIVTMLQIDRFLHTKNFLLALCLCDAFPNTLAVDFF